MSERYRGIEQLVARRAHNPELVGSSPSPATKQIPKNGLTPPFLGIFPFQKSRPKPGNSDFDPCLTHTGIFPAKNGAVFGPRQLLLTVYRGAGICPYNQDLLQTEEYNRKIAVYEITAAITTTVFFV